MSKPKIMVVTDLVAYQGYVDGLKVLDRDRRLFDYKELQNHREHLKRFNQSIGEIGSRDL